MQPPLTITDGVVALRQVQEGDRAVVLSTMRDPLVRQWLNMPSKPADRDFDTLLRTVREGWRTGDRYDYAVTENGADVSLGEPANLPGRPARPALVPPKQVPTRTPYTLEGRAALLHDVGKIHEKYAPILSKTDKLTPEEWDIMKGHPGDGAPADRLRPAVGRRVSAAPDRRLARAQRR